jgi:Family of unknown function (DUF6232)
MSADSARRIGSRQQGRVFYRQHGVEVTSRHLTVGMNRYELAELAELMQARGTRHPGVRVATIIAGIEVTVAAPLLGLAHLPALWLVATVALAVPVIAGLVCAVRWPAEYRLLGRYRGRQVTLLATRDEREFGQVIRALRRAVESTG